MPSTRSSQEDVSDSFGRPQGRGRRRGLNQSTDASMSAASDLDSRPGLRRKQMNHGRYGEQSFDSHQQRDNVVAGEGTKITGQTAVSEEATRQRKEKISSYNGRQAPDI